MNEPVLPQTGLSPATILERLQAFRAHDLEWKSGKLWAYVYPPPAHVAEVQGRAYLEYLSENGLDPSAFPSLVAMENQVMAFCQQHLGGGADVRGSFTTGGTESCMLAVKAARDSARARGIAEPELIFAESAHAAFFKAAHYLDMKAHILPVDPQTFRLRVEDVRAALSSNTALIVGSAPSYAHGVIDPITELAALAKEHGVLFHVDGCIGAFLLPYFARLGEAVPPFDFSIPGVTSISMDLHKYAFCPKGASVVLYRDAALRAHQFFACAGWTGYTMINPTILSSKSGGSIAAAWATLHAFGDQGYLDNARAIVAARKGLEAGIGAIDGLRVLGRPEASLLAFAADGEGQPSVFHVADEMKERGFDVQVQLRLGAIPESLHVSLLPQSGQHLETFLQALRESVLAARSLSFGPLVGMLQQLAPAMAAQTPDSATIQGLFASAGIDPRALPGRRADMNQVMNLLPPAWREAVLREVVGALFQT